MWLNILILKYQEWEGKLSSKSFEATHKFVWVPLKYQQEKLE